MYSFAWSLFPVTFTLAAFTTMTGSPVSRCGEKLALCFPRRSVATRVASRPSVAPSASTTFQCRSISAVFVAYVFICSLIRLVLFVLGGRGAEPPDFPVFHRDEAQAVRRC